MRIIICILLFLSALHPLKGQDTTVLFNNSYSIKDSVFRAFSQIEPIEEGSLVVGWYTNFSNPLRIASIINNNGEIINEFVLDSLDLGEGAFLNNFLLSLGNDDFISALSVNGDNDDVDIQLIKFNLSGEIYWKIEYGSNQTEVVRSFTQSEDGGFLIVGEYWPFENPGFAETEYYLLKVDADGNQEWEKTFKWNGANARLRSAVSLEDGGFLLGGGRFDGSETIVTYSKVDSLGQVQWLVEKPYDCGFVIKKLPDAGYLLNSCIGEESVILIKLNENFDIEWEKSVMLPNNDQFSFYSVPLIKQGGGFIVTSNFTNNNGFHQPSILYFDTDGNLNWAKNYTLDSNNYCYLRDVSSNPDGTYTLVGAQLSGFQKGWVLKIDSLGNSCEIPDCDTTLLTACLYIPEGQLCCAAVETEVVLDYILVTDSLTINCFDLSENLYAEYENGGTILWDFGDGNMSTESFPVHTYENANFYDVTLSVILCGDTTSVFETVKVGEPVGIEQINNNKVNFYPNPATTTVTFEYNQLERREQLSIYNSLGQLIQVVELNPSSNTKTISTQEFRSGIYYWQLGQASGKLSVY